MDKVFRRPLFVVSFYMFHGIGKFSDIFNFLDQAVIRFFRRP
ncbi:hypothetical protein [Neisseria sicca]|nr:hypothetical protein [Neisseria sicca]